VSSLQDRLREQLDYNPETGILTWKISKPRIHIGMRAGSLHCKKHRGITFEGKNYLEHRLIWVWMTGEEPTEYIDHKNRVRDDNRWENLREASHAENYINSQTFGRMRGIYPRYYKKSGTKYRVRINTRVPRERIDLGEFSDLEEAIAARRAKEIEIWGEFACER
jgi:Demerecviridae HNH endonuclease